MEPNSLPFPHLIIDDFLPESVFEQLCEVVGELEFQRIESDLFSFEQSEDLTQNSAFSFFKEKLRELIPQIEKAFEVSPRVIDMMAASYHDGDHLLPHDDRLEERKIAYTFYLAPSEKGGELELLESAIPFAVKEIISPVSNRLVLFKVSEKSLHQIREIEGELPRISISGWFS